MLLSHLVIICFHVYKYYHSCFRSLFLNTYVKILSLLFFYQLIFFLIHIILHVFISLHLYVIYNGFFPHNQSLHQLCLVKCVLQVNKAFKQNGTENPYTFCIGITALLSEKLIYQIDIFKYFNIVQAYNCNIKHKFCNQF